MSRPPEEPITAVARRWRAAEPDSDIQAELDGLLAGPPADLIERFGGRLRFGTAGLRAAVGAGPTRMNRLVVRQAAAGLAAWLLAEVDRAAERGVVIGRDARRKSDVFALDSARVLAAAGLRVHLFTEVVPTPVVAWSITEIGAAAGVVVTASHNPPADNGYKVYMGNGAQIVSPVDAEISARIAAIDPLSVPLADPDDDLILALGPDHRLLDAYVEHAAGLRYRPELAPTPIAYTALHGVGGRMVERVFDRAGLGRLATVAEQHEPDGRFPTVAFPNPEEPGAMDLVVERARAVGATVALANDPDADRLGVAVIDRDGRARALTGDEVGWLIADHVLEHTTGDDRLVITTLVSSSLLSKMAAAHGVHCAEVYTGFKWIALEAERRPEWRLVFGYEQALGYLIGDRPLDKDGITAAVVMAEIAAAAAAEGTTLLDRLERIADRFGRHLTVERSIRMDPVDGAAAVDRLRTNRPSTIGDHRVEDVIDYPEAGLVRFVLSGGVRVQIRPSGTEPKVKIYAEGVDVDPTPAVDAVVALIAGG